MDKQYSILFVYFSKHISLLTSSKKDTFSEHPSAVLYAEDLRPPGYERKAPKYDVGLISTGQEDEEKEEEEADNVEAKIHVLPHNLSRHVRHDLKKAHISKGLVTNYESQLIQFIDIWLNDTQCLENVCLEIQVVSNNQFERYVLHTMCRYYGFSSFSKYSYVKPKYHLYSYVSFR